MTPAANWREALSHMEQSIDECLATLSKYEEQFSKVLHERPDATTPEPVQQSRITLWDEKLHDAEKQAADVEQLLAEQEAVWGRWRQTFSNWQQMVNDVPHALAKFATTSQVART